MCGNVGTRTQQPKPNKEEIAVMGCDESMCAGCELYGWHNMLGEWRPLDGWCSINTKIGAVLADTPKCHYFVKRGDL